MIYKMLMGRLAMSFEVWRNTASQTLRKRRHVVNSIARLKHRVRIEANVTRSKEIDRVSIEQTLMRMNLMPPNVLCIDA